MFTEDYNNMSVTSALDSAIKNAQDRLLSLQHSDGYWVFELEADCTIPAEYIMMMHYLDDIDNKLQAKLPIIYADISQPMAVTHSTQAVRAI